MQDNKIVLFDWGGVVVNLGNHGENHHRAIISLARKLGSKMSEAEIIAGWLDSNETNVNTLSDPNAVKEWVLDVCNDKFGCQTDYDTFYKVYFEEFLSMPHYQEVVDFAHSLKHKCQIGVLSNLALFDREAIDRHYNLKKFNKVYLSFELGMVKPDRKIYEYIQKDLNFSPEQILFIDDLEENVKAAKNCGWYTCHATGHDLPRIKSTVEEFLA